ncbi:hypothetical protein X975_19510, partial [Stegodyphus mimosarum]
MKTTPFETSAAFYFHCSGTFLKIYHFLLLFRHQLPSVFHHALEYLK